MVVESLTSTHACDGVNYRNYYSTNSGSVSYLNGKKFIFRLKADAPDVSVDTVAISCANSEINPDWGAVVGEKVKLEATIKENTDDHTFDDYEM